MSVYSLKQGWGTRYKFKSFPKYLYYFGSSTSKKKFRVCKKVNGKVVTVGYFADFEIARAITKCLED